MRTLTLSISKALLGVLILLSLHGNAQWTQVASSANVYKSILFAEDSICIVQSSYPEAIYRTADAGQNWSSSIVSSLTNDYTGFFINKNEGFVVYETGEVYMSSNGGASWAFISIIDSAQGLSTNGYNISGIYFVSIDTGFVFFTKVFFGNSSSVCFKTIDGGNNWSNTIENIDIQQVHFINNFIGFLGTNDYIFRTSDGGANWVPVLGGTSYNFGPYGVERYLQFVNTTDGFLMDGDGNLYKSTDAGLNWNIIYTDTNPTYPSAQLFFVDAMNGFLGGPHGGHICKTDDGGLTWVVNSFPTDSIWSLFFATKDIGYAIGDPGTPGNLYKTSNGGIYTTLNIDVWPGDANADKTANNYDVLNIGIAYNEIGSVRSGASLSWIAQPATDWGNAFSNGADYKHADCDGDGIVDTNDVQAILLNYGSTHNKTDNNIVVTAADPLLYLEFPSDSVAVSTSISIPIYFGASSLAVDSLYGLAFSISYDTTLIKSASVTANFNNSWLGTINTDMFSVSKNLPDNERIDIAVSRTDQQNKLNGFGQIGELNIVTSDNISGKLLITKALQLNISNVKAITASGIAFAVNTAGDSVVVVDDSLAGFSDVLIDFKAIIVYPNPAKNNISIQVNGASIKSVTMYNILGQNEVNITGNINSKLQINLADYPAGMYMLQIETDKGKVTKKFSKE